MREKDVISATVTNLWPEIVTAHAKNVVRPDINMVVVTTIETEINKENQAEIETNRSKDKGAPKQRVQKIKNTKMINKGGHPQDTKEGEDLLLDTMTEGEDLGEGIHPTLLGLEKHLET